MHRRFQGRPVLKFGAAGPQNMCMARLHARTRRSRTAPQRTPCPRLPRRPRRMRWSFRSLVSRRCLRGSQLSSRGRSAGCAVLRAAGWVWWTGREEAGWLVAVRYEARRGHDAGDAAGAESLARALWGQREVEAELPRRLRMHGLIDQAPGGLIPPLGCDASEPFT